MKKTVKEFVFEREFYDETELSLCEYIAELQDAVSVYPEEIRNTAKIVLWTRSSYDEHSIAVNVIVERFETDEEEKARELVEYREKLRVENEEKALLTKLTLKYGNR